MLLSNPLTKDDFPIHLGLALVHIVVSLRKGVVKPKAKISSKHGPSPLAYAGDEGLLLPSQLRSQSLMLWVSLAISKQENLEPKSKKESIACHSFLRLPPY